MIRLFLKLPLIIICLFLCQFYCLGKEIVLNKRESIQKQLRFENSVYIINHVFNLKNSAVEIPNNCELKFHGGRIINGTLIGENTKITYSGEIFNHVRIQGSWLVPTIYSSMFGDSNKRDVLKELIALSSDSIDNDIFVDHGEYEVSAPSNTKGAINLKSRTKFIVNATIRLIPNNFAGCSVIKLTGINNVIISGNGFVIGDKDNHLGCSGEWGMGIQIMDSNHVTISNLTVKNCWGDCIYIGGNSKNVIITDCDLNHARRQGISVTDANNCQINNCKIHDIGGTDPEYAIDFEPNANCSVHYMKVSNTTIHDCKGGIIAGIKGVTAPNASVGDIIIDNCIIFNLRTKNTFRWHNCKDILIKNCSIDKHLKNCAFAVDAKDIKYKNIKLIK